MGKIAIQLLGSPISTQSAYLQRGRIRFLAKKAKKLKNSYIQQVKEQYHGELLSCPIVCFVKLYRDDNRVRDRDNFNKLLLDSMEGIVFENDRQIINAGVSKNYGEPRIEFIMFPIQGEDLDSLNVSSITDQYLSNLLESLGCVYSPTIQKKKTKQENTQKKRVGEYK